ncbi:MULTISPECIES: CoA pyrophosphatase [Ferrimonas]|uniref:CoA pyrophosphatase n=1 Tax=Ferrimonas TaxID=44011 RepID=UPI0004245A41|nr:MULTISPECIES: CoA pyrophosphatase [Ferrimonas]USD39020.1 CoA pyrophosphatase [Ferrimonas sp. SCSIO 43195]
MNRQQFLSQFALQPMVAGENPLRRHPLAPSFKDASVLLALCDSDDGLQLLLTKRASHLRHHANQISFPGGKMDAEDRSPWHTATREAWEEVGLSPNALTQVGALPEFHTISRFRMQPQIAFIEQDFIPRLSQDEVSECFFVPLAHLIEPDNRRTVTIERHNGSHPVYFMFYQHHRIWGATAAVIEQLIRHLGYPRAPN